MLAFLDAAHSSEYAAAWLVWLIDASVKGTALLALAWALSFVLRRSEARVRRGLWNVALLSVLVTPMLSYLTPSWRLAILPTLPDRLQNEAAAGPRFAKHIAPGLHTPPAPVTSPNPVAQPPLRLQQLTANPLQLSAPRESLRTPWAVLILGVWLIGVVAVLSRLLIGLRRADRYARTAVPLFDEPWCNLNARLSAQMHLPRKISLLRHDEIAVPFTWGFLRPVVLLPADAESWSTRRRYLVLAHELTHIRRNDWLMQILAQIACAVYWFNPLTWLATGRLFLERERACDSDVIALGTKPSEYASHLVDITKLMPSKWTAPVATLAMVRGSHLRGRVVSILNDTNRGRCGMILVSPAVLGMAVLGVSLGGVRLANARPAGKRATIVQRAAPEVGGVWMAEWMGDKVHLRVETPSDNDWSFDVTIPTSEFGSSTTDPHLGFQLSRDAGVVFFEGGFDDTVPIRRGSGSFGFYGDPGYVQEMEKLGFQLADQERLLVFALLDVSLSYTREICSLSYEHLSADQLLVFRTHGVSPEFIQGLAELGYVGVSPDQLVVCRNQDVSPGFIRELYGLGYADLALAQLITFRVHDVSPEFINELAELGYSGMAPEELIAFRTHLVGSAFIREAAVRGYRDVSASELIELRIHGFDH